MRVAKLEIENYRGIRRGKINFERHSVLVGSNNTGKTCIIEALTLLLGRDRLIRDLTEHDFYGSDPEPTNRIRLIATITDFPDNSIEKNPDWFRDGRAVPKWIDEENHEIHASPENPSWKLCCQIAGQALFDKESLAVDFVRYFHDSDFEIDPFNEDQITPVPGKLIRELGFFLVRTNRTWDKMLSWGSELFRRTLNSSDAQPSKAILSERNRLRKPENPIEDDPNISPLISRVNTEISNNFQNSAQLKLRVTNTDSRSVMDAIYAHFSNDSGHTIPASRQGSGLISFQGLLLLIELGQSRMENGDNFILALEEPEIHLPPSTQQQMIIRAQSLSSQTFITTHSPTVAAMANPTSVILLENRDGELSSKPFLSSPLNEESPNWERQLFQQNRGEIISSLMNQYVLIPEGVTEFYLIKTILNAVLLADNWITNERKPLTLNIGITPTKDAKIVEYFKKLSSSHSNVCCLVDGDKAGQQYAEDLKKESPLPSSIISWNQDAAIEDAIGWILSGDEENSVKGISKSTSSSPSSVTDIVIHLKSKKMDIIFYESIADTIANAPKLLERAKTLFKSLSLACQGKESDLFKYEEGIFVFKP